MASVGGRSNIVTIEDLRARPPVIPYVLHRPPSEEKGNALGSGAKLPAPRPLPARMGAVVHIRLAELKEWGREGNIQNLMDQMGGAQLPPADRAEYDRWMPIIRANTGEARDVAIGVLFNRIILPALARGEIQAKKWESLTHKIVSADFLKRCAELLSEERLFKEAYTREIQIARLLEAVLAGLRRRADAQMEQARAALQDAFGMTDGERRVNLQAVEGVLAQHEQNVQGLADLVNGNAAAMEQLEAQERNP